jgi:hypothetical protein
VSDQPLLVFGCGKSAARVERRRHECKVKIQDETLKPSFVCSGQFTGTMTPIVAEAFCSTLGDDPKPSLLDQDIYTLQGTKGEKVVIGLEKSGNDNSGEATALYQTKSTRSCLPRASTSLL